MSEGLCRVARRLAGWPEFRSGSRGLIECHGGADQCCKGSGVDHIALPQIDNEQIKPLKEYKGGDAEAGSEIVSDSAFIPATLSAKVQTDLLRKEMGFKGLIVSDAMSMSGLTIYFTQEEAGVRAFLAGRCGCARP